MTIVCLSQRDSDTAGNWRERPGSKVVEFDLCLENRFKSHFYGPNRSQRLVKLASKHSVGVSRGFPKQMITLNCDRIEPAAN